MSQNHQTKVKIKRILLIADPNQVTNQLRRRLAQNQDDRVGIITNKPAQLAQINPRHELVFENHQDLNGIITSQGFDAVYIDLAQKDGNTIEKIITALRNSKVKQLILMLNANDQPNDPRIKQIVELVKGTRLITTVIRAAKLGRSHTLSYQAVHNAQPAGDSSVSAVSVADLAYQVIQDPQLEAGADVGIAQLPYK